MNSKPSAIDKAGIVIYSSPFCGYCAAAKSLLSGAGADFVEIDVFAEPQRRREMIELSGRRTVPQIFIGGRHIGGFDDLQSLDAEGGLEPLLTELRSNA